MKLPRPSCNWESSPYCGPWYLFGSGSSHLFAFRIYFAIVDYSKIYKLFAIHSRSLSVRWALCFPLSVFRFRFLSQEREFLRRAFAPPARIGANYFRYKCNYSFSLLPTSSSSFSFSLSFSFKLMRFVCFACIRCRIFQLYEPVFPIFRFDNKFYAPWDKSLLDVVARRENRTPSYNKREQLCRHIQLWLGN